MWAERVSAWRGSGQNAFAYARAHGFSHSALRYWIKRVARPRKQSRAATMVPLVRKRPAIEPAVTQAESSEIVIEIAAARIRVSRGFDQELFAQVLRALGGGAR